jgi:hypothetical protein
VRCRGFLFLGLHDVAPYCFPGGVNMTLVSAQRRRLRLVPLDDPEAPRPARLCNTPPYATAGSEYILQMDSY